MYSLIKAKLATMWELKNVHGQLRGSPGLRVVIGDVAVVNQELPEQGLHHGAGGSDDLDE